MSELSDATSTTMRVGEIEPGAMITGRFRVEELLGVGGMSSVYRVYDTTFERTVALKMLHPHVVKERASLERFVQEARAENRLKHVNIVGAQAVGVTEEGQLFMVMDYLKGESLSDSIERSANGLPEKEALEIFLQICAGLEVAHANGVVHRDLKPSNIMLVDSPDGASSLVKIVDFGIARLLSDEDNVDAQRLTKAGSVLGSPAYMSPEQCRGDELDARSDIYSLGCLMYEALTRVSPFACDSELETMCKHLNDMPVGFDVVAPRAVLSDGIEEIVFRCLQKKPSARYQSVSEITADLMALVNNEPMSVASAELAAPATEEKSKKTGGHKANQRRRLSEQQRKGVAIACGVALLLGAGATAFFTMTPMGRAEWLELRFIAGAALNAEADSQQLRAARAVTDARLRSDARVVPHAAFEREIAIAKALPDPQFEVLTSEQRYADALWSTGQKGEAAAKYGAILQGTRTAVHQGDLRYYIPNEVIERATATPKQFCEAGVIFQNHTLNSRAVACYERVIASGARDTDSLLQARLAIAEIMLKRSDIARADEHTIAAMEMLAESGYVKPIVLLGLANVAHSYLKSDQKLQAEKLYEFIAAQRAVFAQLSGEARANLLHDLATHYRRHDQPAKAQPLYEECIAIRKQLGITGKPLSRAIFDAGDNLLSMNQPKKAEPYMEQALALWEQDSEWKFDANRDTEFDTIYCSIADTYFKNAKYDRSEKYFARALDIWQHKPHQTPFAAADLQERDRLVIGLIDSVKHEPNGAMRGAQLATSLGYTPTR